MIRPVTLIALVCAASAGLNLYSVKRDAQLEEQSTVRIGRETKDVRAHAALLHAEYDLLSDPDRLQDLARQVLKLQPTEPKQYVSLADLTKRLPVVAPLPMAPDAPKIEAPKIEAPKPELVAEKVEPKPVPEKAAPEKIVLAVTAPKPVPAPTIVAAAQPAPRPAPAPAPKPAIMAETHAAPAPNYVRPQPAPRPMPAMAEAPAPMPAPYVGSALGMARSRPQGATPARFMSSDSGADR